ncbi:MAG: ribbon-helix-helix domain-containing protein [Candidatus Melainabacteria bacterium]|nr:ribbon-helix-helix domain-containing protein [Candidatus Melainabacteria bacterium]
MAKQKSARVLISLPDTFLDEIDQIADEEHRTRSELIREALRNYIRSLETMENGSMTASAILD